jgi:CHAT domain-containing protein
MSRAVLLLALAAAAIPLLGAPESAASHPAPVALVCRVEGEATLRPAPGAPSEPLALRRHLPPGAILTVAPRSTVTVVFFDGQRYALEAEARARVEAAGLRVEAGRARHLASVPEVVDLAPLLQGSSSRRRATAVRIRGTSRSEGAVSGLVPRDGAPVRRAALALSFTPLPEVEVYHLVVEDETGGAVFTKDVQAPRAQLPPGLLRPGTLYYWWVEPKVPPRPEMRGEAVFSTLDEKEERAREALASAAGRSADPDLALLLAEVDRALGLSEPAAKEESPGARPEPAAGVVVEEVARGSPGERAGLRPGDLILSWCRMAPAGDPPCLTPRSIDSPFDFADLEIEQIPRGGVRLTGRRSGDEVAWDLSPGSSRLEVRPVLSEELRELHRQGQGRAAAAPPPAAAERWRAAAAKAGGHRLAAWFLARAAKVPAEGKGWREADALYVEAIERAERGGGRQVAAHLLMDRGDDALGHGDPARAEESFRRAESILKEVKGESLARAAALNKLASVAMRYGEREEAEGLLRRSLVLREKLDPGGLLVASSLHSLGVLAMASGDEPAAEQDLKSALALYAVRAPDDPAAADTLSELAKPARRRGDLATAESYYRRALAIRQSASPESLPVASSFINLGVLAEERGQLSQAESYLRRAVAICRRLAPDGPLLPLALHNLGDALLVLGPRGLRQQGADLVCQAVELVERQPGRLSGTELARSLFGATIRGYYHDCLRARVYVGQPMEAFHILERGRARVFLEQLAERDLAPPLPPEIARQWKALNADYDQAQSQLGRLEPDRDGEEIERLRGRLRDLYVEKQELVAKIHSTSPRLAAVRYPQPLDLSAARRSLDPGTVLLAYSVGPKQTYLLVIQPTERRRHGLTAMRLPVGERALRTAVRTFRILLQDGSSDRRALTAQAQRLYDLLLRPAERQLTGASRLLISPDGPLHTLPFAALVHDGVFLAEWKPVHSVLSATVYAEIRRSRRPSRPLAESELVAFGDPVYTQPGEDRSAAPAATLEVLAAVRRGLSLAPLPSSRREVLGIASLFPRARTLLGAEATEEKAKAITPQARFLHFACHGLLDERFPLNSALALSIPEHPARGQDNGLLQAWEIFESLRLDADLVTLSACDSGLGKEMGGEGLIGLTRAFQYAGARSVLASLWSVADASTAELMRRFYGYLQQGKSKDEALRLAQVDLIHAPDKRFAHPFYWAAFQLHGDFQ